MSIIGAPLQGRIVTLFTDAEGEVTIDRVKATCWTAGNTVLTIARYFSGTEGEHYYINWPRERFLWFRDDPERS